MLNRHGSKPSKNQRNLRETLNLFLTDYVFPADRADWCADLSDSLKVEKLRRLSKLKGISA